MKRRKAVKQEESVENNSNTPTNPAVNNTAIVLPLLNLQYQQQ